MKNSRQFQPIEVSCHSGCSYAERPTSFVLDEERYDIADIEREWFEPGEKHFIVIAVRENAVESEKRLHICYDTREDTWQLKETQ